MRALSAQQILHVWEQAHDLHGVDRALLLLATASADASQDWALLSIGERDARLLDLREKTFGQALAGFAECPQCAERLEFRLEIPDMRMTAPTQSEPEFSAEGFQVRFRLPDSRDLAAAVYAGTTENARQLLVERCIVQATREDQEVDTADLPEAVISRLGSAISEYSPQADVLLDFDCPACRHRWQAVFDILTFFWTEIRREARRLLEHVHALARAYGWREGEILALSERRRQAYLEMVGA